jgi:hypothetical protein
MAPSRAKKTKQKDSKLSTRAFKSAHELPEFTPPLTPSASVTTSFSSEDRPSSFSLPGSPVSKITPSLQPSPALSANSEFLRSDINPFLLPPLAYHNNAKHVVITANDLNQTKSYAKQSRPKGGAKRRKDAVAPAAEESETLLELGEQEATESSNASERTIPDEPVSQSGPQDLTVDRESICSPQDPAYPVVGIAQNKEPAKEASTPPQPAGNQFTEIQQPIKPLENNVIADTQPPLQPYPQRSGYHPPLGYPYQRYLPPMSYSGGYPPGYAYGPPPPRNGSPYQTAYGSFPGPYPPYDGSPTQRHDSFGSRGSNHGDNGSAPQQPPGDNATAIEDDPGDLLDRISSVIPDIHMLLSRSKLTHGELGLREQLLRKTEAESREAVKQKEDHITRLNKQLHDVEKHHAKDSNRYRFQIGDLEDKIRDLNERLIDADMSKKASNEKIRELDGQKQALLRDRMTLAQAAAEEKSRMIKELDEWKTKANEMLEAERAKTAEEKVRLLNDFDSWKVSARETLDIERQKLGEEHEKNLKEKESLFDGHKSQLMEDFEKEKDSLRSNFQVQKREVEAEFDKLRKEFEAKLSKTQEDLEQAIKTERENCDQWSAERDTITKTLKEERANRSKDVDDQRAALIKQHEDDMAALAKKHKDDLNEQMMGFVSLQEGINKKMTAENEDLRQQIEVQRKTWDEEREELKRMVAGIQDVAQSLEAEKGRLEKLVQCFGEVTDVKSKGDAY